MNQLLQKTSIFFSVEVFACAGTLVRTKEVSSIAVKRDCAALSQSWRSPFCRRFAAGISSFVCQGDHRLAGRLLGAPRKRIYNGDIRATLAD